MATPRLARDEWRIGKAESLAAGLNISRRKMTAAVRFECSSSAELLGLIKAPEMFDNIHAVYFLGELGSMMLNDFNALVRDIDDYRTALRSRFG